MNGSKTRVAVVGKELQDLGVRAVDLGQYLSPGTKIVTLQLGGRPGSRPPAAPKR
jgi:hypothetical protein